MPKHAKKRRPLLQLGAFTLAALLTVSGMSATQATVVLQPIDLGTAANFAVLGGSGITNTGDTKILGTGADMGSHPTGAFTGPTTVTVPAGASKFLGADPITELAKADLALAYADADSREGATTITSGVQTLVPGLYETAEIFALAGGEVLTLDAQGVSNAIFIFQIGSGLTLADSSKVRLIGGAEARNVFWQVTSTAAFAANSVFAGRIMALAAVTAAVGAEFDGQLLAITENVTLDSNTITNNANASAPTASSTSGPTGTTNLGSNLTNAITFTGQPAPDVSVVWEYSQDGSSGWSAIADGTGSTFSLTREQLGGYVRTVVTATNSSGDVTQTSIATTQILPKAPASPVLETAADTGSNSSDGVTSETRPALSLTDLIIGANVLVTATKDDLQETCSTTATQTTQSCSFTDPLADGTWSLTAANIVNNYSSADSGSLSITIDTTAPAIETFTVDQASFATSVLTHSLVFTESVTGLVATDFTLVSNGVICEEPTLSGVGTDYTVTLASCQGEGTIQLRLRAEASQDPAGNIGPTNAYLTPVATRDLTAPTILSVSTLTPNVQLTQGDQLAIRVRFSEPVLVSGNPKLTLRTSSGSQVADYASGSSRDTLIFTYTVQPGDKSSDLDYVSENSLGLNGGTITDTAGNYAAIALSAPGEPGSLGASSGIVIDGDVLRLALARSSSVVEDGNVSWTLTAPSALNCSTLSMAQDVDFGFAGLMSIDSITASVDDKTCTISGTSSTTAAQFGTTSLSIASGFSVSDASGRAHTNIVVGETSIDVTVDPAPGRGMVSVAEMSSSEQAQYAEVLDTGLLNGTSDSVLKTLLRMGMLNAAQNAPKHDLNINFSAIADSNDILHSSSRHRFAAGDSISLELQLNPALVTTHHLESYVKTGENWVFTGEKNFGASVATTSAFTLTKTGTYILKLFVVPNDPAIVTQSNTTGLGGWGNWFSPALKTITLQNVGLPTSSQSHTAEIVISGSVVAAPAPSPRSNLPAPAAANTSTPLPQSQSQSQPQPQPQPQAELSPTLDPTVSSEPEPTGAATQLVKPALTAAPKATKAAPEKVQPAAPGSTSTPALENNPQETFMAKEVTGLVGAPAGTVSWFWWLILGIAIGSGLIAAANRLSRERRA